MTTPSRSRSLPASLGPCAASAALLLALTAAPSASAITMRDDVPNVSSTGNDNPYVALGATYSAVAFIQWTTPGGSFVGSGTLVNSNVPGQLKFLTAAHNVDSEGPGSSPDGIIDASTFNVYFGARTGSDGANAVASVAVPNTSIAVQPLWTNGDGAGLNKGASQYDLAVFTFTLSSVVNAASLPAAYGLSLNNPLGQTATMVGYGNYGLGNNFANTSADGVRRAGRNLLEIVGDAPDNAANTGRTIQTDFDAPNSDPAVSTLGTPQPLTLEASTAGGDSGGPILVDDNGNPLIVGVLFGGFNPTANGRPSEYGDRSIYANVAETANVQFLTGAGVAVPEPSTYALLLAAGGFGLVTVARRRRAAAGLGRA